MKQSQVSDSRPKVSQPAPAPDVWFPFEAIGTQWWIGLYEKMSEKLLDSLKRQIAERIDEFDRAYSRFRDDSLISDIAKQTGTYKLPADADRLMAFYRRLYDLTGGAVTPLIGQALVDAGYDSRYSLQPKKVRSIPAWESSFEYANGKLITHRPVLLDFGAAGKGYLVDIIGELIGKNGVKAYCVDAGGDMVFRHPTQTLSVGLEHPDNPSLAVGVAELNNQALCGSAGNRRAWKGYHHIFDPRTLKSTSNVKATWVVAGSTMLADGLATALFFTEPNKLATLFDFTYALVRADNSVEVAPHFPGEVFVSAKAGL